MPISITFISIPTDEVVNSNVVHLPTEGGVIGRRSGSSVFLPDQSRTISRKHAEIKYKRGRYYLVDTSNNGVLINNRASVRGKLQILNDADIITIQSYKLLVSIIDLPPDENSIKTEKDNDESEEAAIVKKEISLDFDVEDDEVSILNEKVIDVKSTDSETIAKIADKNIFSDDPFYLDPFDEVDIHEESVEEKEVISTELITENNVLTVDKMNLDKIISSDETNLNINSLNQLVSLLSNSNSSSFWSTRYNQEKFFKVAEMTIKEFLLEFKPESIEQQVNNFNTHWGISSKEKRYWRTYRKYFKYRYDNGEYVRLFKSLFIENLQKMSEE